MKTKFKPGDIVRFHPDTELMEEFVKDWGHGPFILTDNFADNKWHAKSLDGRPQMTPWDTPWSHSDDGDLILDVFLDSAYKAKEKDEKSKYNRKPAKPAARRGRVSQGKKGGTSHRAS